MQRKGLLLGVCGAWLFALSLTSCGTAEQALPETEVSQESQSVGTGGQSYSENVSRFAKPINTLPIPFQDPVLDHVSANCSGVIVVLGDDQVELLLGVLGVGG